MRKSGKKARDKLEKTFLEADDQDEVMDAFLALLPSDDECYETAISDEPPKFVKKLKDIDASSEVISNAVREYASAKLMRMRCEKRRFPRMRLVQMDKNLLSTYDSVNDTLEERELTPEQEALRGRKLLDQCRQRADNERLNGFTIDSSVARGELQCIANDEGFEKRSISWNRMK